MGRITELSNIDIDSARALGTYCRKASQLFQDLQNEMEFLEQYMKAECAKLPPASDESHMPKNMRAWLVAKHAAAAKDHCQAALKEMAKLHGAFRKHFVPENMSSKKPRINVADA